MLWAATMVFPDCLWPLLQYNDEKGIKWPVSVAPEVLISCLSDKDQRFGMRRAVADTCVAAGSLGCC